MICLKCGQDSPGNYCSNCGAPLYGDKQSADNEFSDLDIQDNELHRHANEKHEKQNAPRKRSRIKRVSESKDKSNKSIKKEMKQRDSRIRRLEDELEDMNSTERKRSRRERREQDLEGNSEQELREAVVKSAVGVTVLSSRFMQLASFFLMAYMVWLMQRSFLADGGRLGNVYTMLEERNYALALYVGIAGFVLFFGVVWCLWILSKKDAGGNTRLKKYDTGRGFIPFLICAAACVLVPFALAQLPASEQITGISEIPVSAESWQALANGARAALAVIDSQRSVLILCSLSGAALSFVRKILRV